MFLFVYVTSFRDFYFPVAPYSSSPYRRRAALSLLAFRSHVYFATFPHDVCEIPAFSLGHFRFLFIDIFIFGRFWFRFHIHWYFPRISSEYFRDNRLYTITHRAYTRWVTRRFRALHIFFLPNFGLLRFRHRALDDYCAFIAFLSQMISFAFHHIEVFAVAFAESICYFLAASPSAHRKQALALYAASRAMPRAYAFSFTPRGWPAVAAFEAFHISLIRRRYLRCRDSHSASLCKIRHTSRQPPNMRRLPASAKLYSLHARASAVDIFICLTMKLKLADTSFYRYYWLRRAPRVSAKPLAVPLHCRQL